MEANRPSQEVKRSRSHEGPKKQLIAFGLSIILTLLAFIVVNYKDNVDATFLGIFLVLMALIQAVVQAVFWMHLNEKGSAHMRVALTYGGVIGTTAIVAGIFWTVW